MARTKHIAPVLSEAEFRKQAGISAAQARRARALLVKLGRIAPLPAKQGKKRSPRSAQVHTTRAAYAR